jgi:conjugal transfer ATP-binding protein TraC
MYQSASIELTPLPAAGYIAVMRRYFNMFGTWDYAYDESDLIRNQFLPPSARIKSRMKTIRVDRDGKKGSQHIGILTVKNYPKRANLGIMDLMRGNPDGMGTQISMPYALTTTIHFPDQSAKIGKVRAKGVLITQQSFGNMIRWVPILAAKKHGFDVLGSALDEGDNAVEACTTLMLFHPDKRQVSNMMTNLEQLYSSYTFGMAPERYIVWPSIYNSLPLCPSPDSIENTHRFKTMGSRHAAQFLPVIDEWRGYGDAMILTTRRGRPFGYDFFSDQNNNYNWLLIAASGAGKSFAVQRITQDYLSVGTKIWIVDKGRSHAKFTKAHQGELVEFTEIAHCSLNPFSKVIDIDEDIGILVALLGKMCNPDTQTDAADAVRIMEAIKSTWTTYGNKMEITHVYRYLNAQHTDERSVEMARRLYPFTMEGPYGSWFRGPSTLETNAQLTTLELSALGGKKHLQQVILQLLVINVEQAMYRSHDGVKKMLLVEEGGDLLREPGFATFLAQLYSKVRKEEGSVGLVLQSLAQLIDSGRDGISIMGSAATRIIMEQEAEAIDTARRQDWMSISEGEANLLKSVHTVQGKAGYSEMYFRTPNGAGIARLVESRFNQVLFSTKGPEFKGILAAVDAGEDVAKAVHRFIANEAIA